MVHSAAVRSFRARGEGGGRSGAFLTAVYNAPIVRMKFCAITKKTVTIL